MFSSNVFVAKNTFCRAQIGARKRRKPHGVNVPIADVCEFRQSLANCRERLILKNSIGA